MDYRKKSFKIKFSNAGRQLGVKPHEVISLKIRECVNSYAEYRDFLQALVHETGIKWSPIDSELQGQGYLLSEGNNRVIIVEHETGLEILYIAGSIASLIGLVPLILHGWRAFRNRRSRRPDFDDRGIEIRRLDEHGHLSEDQVHDSIAFMPMPLIVNSAVASAAQNIECDLRGLMNQMQSLTRRVEVLEELIGTKTKRRKSGTGKKRAD